METAKVFDYDGIQAVGLPESYRFHENEVFIRKLGNAVMLIPKEEAWRTFLDGLSGFTDDFFQDGRDAQIPEKREKE